MIEWGKDGLPTREQVMAIANIRHALLVEGIQYSFTLKASWPGAVTSEGVTLYGMQCVDGPVGVLVEPRQ